MSYPEHDKLSAQSDAQVTLAEFLDWLASQGLVITRFAENGEFSHELGQSLVYSFFGVDPVKLERERRQMLDELRSSSTR